MQRGGRSRWEKERNRLSRLSLSALFAPCLPAPHYIPPPSMSDTPILSSPHDSVEVLPISPLAEQSNIPLRIKRTGPQLLHNELVAEELIAGAPSRNGGRLLEEGRDPWTHNAWSVLPLSLESSFFAADARFAQTGTKSNGMKSRRSSLNKPSRSRCPWPCRPSCRKSTMPTPPPSGIPSTPTSRVGRLFEG